MAHKLFRLALVVLTLLPLVYYDLACYRYTPLTGVEWDYTDHSYTVLQITRVAPGSPGAAAGLQVGDRLLAAAANCIL